MNEKEKKFVDSIRNKISKYEIPVTLKECFLNTSGILTNTVYNDKTYEVIDTGIENLLICKSFLYWAENYSIIELPGSKTGVLPTRFYYFQRELAKEVENYKRVVIDKCRQSGISTIASLYCLWRLITKSSENIDCISITRQKSIDFVKKMRPSIEIQPDWFKKELIEDNKQRIRFKHPNGGISTCTSEAATETAGRADSLSLLILDELAFYRSANLVESIMSAAMPALSKTQGMYWAISTPNSTVGSGAVYYNLVQEARMNFDDFTKFLSIDVWEIPDDENTSGARKGWNKILNKAIEEDYYHRPDVKKKYQKQFDPILEDPKSNPWLAFQYKSLGQWKYDQEIRHKFILGQNRVFPADIMSKIKTKIEEPICKDYLCLNGKPVKEVKNLWIWKHPVPERKYIVTCDPSSGVADDRACIQVLDVVNMEQAAEFYGYVTTLQLPILIKDIARVYNDAYVVIEANSIGDGVFNAVYYSENDPYVNVFKQKKNNNGVSRFTGWITDIKTRKLITNEVGDWLSIAELFDKFGMYSERVYAELETWIIDSKGKYIHSQGCHDDAIMALGLALFNRNNAIKSSGNVLGFVDEDGSVITYDREEYRKRLEAQSAGIKSGSVAVSSDSHDNELSSIMNDGRKKLNLDDTNYAGMYSNTENFAAGSKTSMSRLVQDRYGVRDIDTYNWLIS